VSGLFGSIPRNFRAMVTPTVEGVAPMGTSLTLASHRVKAARVVPGSRVDREGASVRAELPALHAGDDGDESRGAGASSGRNSFTLTR
jgi:hypothetical protein